MEPRTAARRDLVLVAVGLVGVSRFVEGPILWAVAGALVVATVLGALQVLGNGELRGVPVERVILPAVAAGAAVGAVRLVPVGLLLAPALLLAALVIDRAIAIEVRLETISRPPTSAERDRVLVLALVVAFTAFAGAAAAVPGGLAEPDGGGPPLALPELALLAGVDALVAFLLGYRVSALRRTTIREVAVAALTYAIVVAIGAGAVRALGLPRLLGPALLTLVFFLWDALQGAGPARRRDPRWLWEVGLLLVLGLLVVAMNARAPL